LIFTTGNHGARRNWRRNFQFLGGLGRLEILTISWCSQQKKFHDILWTIVPKVVPWLPLGFYTTLVVLGPTDPKQGPKGLVDDHQSPDETTSVSYHVVLIFVSRHHTTTTQGSQVLSSIHGRRTSRPLFVVTAVVHSPLVHVYAAGVSDSFPLSPLLPMWVLAPLFLEIISPLLVERDLTCLDLPWSLRRVVSRADERIHQGWTRSSVGYVCHKLEHRDP
jgi:hypothetical protein